MPAGIESIASETELAVSAVVLVLTCLAGAFWTRTRAPAATIGLVTGVFTGGAALWIASTDSPHGAPMVALASASAAMATSGFLALWFLPASTKDHKVFRVGVVVLLVAPLAGLATLLAVQDACPLYVMRGAGVCFYEYDVLGGWSSAAALTMTLDVIVVAALLLVTDRRARGAEADVQGERHLATLSTDRVP